MNVVTAYLNGTLEEEVYMELPDQLMDLLDKVIIKKKIGSRGTIFEDKKIIGIAKWWKK